jgi:hypothetical protein
MNSLIDRNLIDGVANFQFVSISVDWFGNPERFNLLNI